MPIDSTSTLAAVQAAYDDNAPPFTTVEQCSNFIKACSILLRRTPQESGTREAHLKMRIEALEGEKEAAQEWFAANSTTGANAGGPRVTRASFENFRR